MVKVTLVEKKRFSEEEKKWLRSLSEEMATRKIKQQKKGMNKKNTKSLWNPPPHRTALERRHFSCEQIEQPEG